MSFIEVCFWSYGIGGLLAVLIRLYNSLNTKQYKQDLQIVTPDCSFKIDTPEPEPEPIKNTSDENINLVISGLVHLGVKKTKAKSIVNKMCKDKYYDDAQDLFEACFPHINS